MKKVLKLMLNKRGINVWTGIITDQWRFAADMANKFGIPKKGGGENIQ